MKNASRGKKLSVRRERVRKLSERDLEKAGGGLYYNTGACAGTGLCQTTTDTCNCVQETAACSGSNLNCF